MLSNLFNLITQQHPELNNYHMGWRSDVNRNLPNNYETDPAIGKQYPAVHFDSSIDGDGNLETRNADLAIRLYFDDLMYYDNQGNPTTKTMAEHWRDLWNWGMQFILTVEEAGKSLARTPGMMIAIKDRNIRWAYDAHVHNSRLVSVYFDFTLVVKIACISPNLVPKLGSNENYPYPMEGWDYEDPRFKEDSDGSID